MVRVRKPAAIVCDIEGTTTSTRFWVEVLAPFIKDNIEDCLRDQWDCSETKDVITVLRNKTIENNINGDALPPIVDESASQRDVIDSVVRNVRFQMQQRRSSNELKSIQLLVWLYGYQNDLLKGHVYQDVQPAFKRWRRELGIRIFTFASGPTIAQEMLFACSLSGNLTPFIEEHFDGDNVGKKVDQDSYRNITKIINESSRNIIFLSDNIQDQAGHTPSNDPILVHSDSLASLLAISGTGADVPLVLDIRDRLLHLFQSDRLVKLSWVKAHIGVTGNERADELAKTCHTAGSIFIELPAPMSWAKREIRGALKSEWDGRWQNSPNGSGTKVFFPRLTHRESVPRLQLNFYTTQFLSGHGKFSQYLNRFRLRSGDRCECGDIQTGFHMLLDCPIFEPLQSRLRRPVYDGNTSILADDDVLEELNQNARAIHDWLSMTIVP